MLFAFCLASVYFKDFGTIDWLLCIILFYFTTIVVSEQVLGVFGFLTVENLLWINLALLFVTLGLLHNKKFNLDIANGLARSIHVLPYRKFYIFLLAFILGFSLVKLAINLINPAFGWDNLNYHFPFAVEWLKHRNLDIPLVVFDNPCPSYYPLNGSLVYLWLMLPFKNVFLADLGQLPFFVITFLSIFNICGKFNVSREYSFFAAVLMLITPNYFRQLAIAYVDVMVCAWFLLSLNYLIDIVRKPSLKGTMLFSLSWGMLIGTKTMGLMYGLILVPFFLYFLFKKKPASALANLIVFGSLAAILGGFGYIRNFLETGNPLYPLTFKIANIEVFKGVMDKSNFTAFAKRQDYSLPSLLFHEGLGAGTVLFVVPALFLFIFTLIKKKEFEAGKILLLSSFVYIYLAYRYVFSIPNARYLYPAIGLGFVLCFIGLSTFRFPAKILKPIIALCLLTSLPEMAKPKLPEFSTAMILSIVLLFVLLAGFKILQKHFLRIGLITAVIAIIALGFLNSNYNKNEFSRYKKSVKYSGFWPDATRAWEWLNNNTNGNNIAYAGRPVPFPLYGTNFKNNVYYVSVNKIDPVKLHYFSGSYYKWGSDFLTLHQSLEARGNYRSAADYNVWLANLRKRNIDFLFVYSLHQTKEIIFPIEDAWARHNPDKFMPVFGNETIHIYKIVVSR
jgi:hypothetical protein